VRIEVIENRYRSARDRASGRKWVDDRAQFSSWPGKSAKRVFALDVPAIHDFLA
jgi:hypothetical protein